MTDIQSNNVSNPDTHFITLSETYFEARDKIPTFKYQDQISIPKSSHKRVCKILSPIEQKTSEDNNLLQLTQTTIKASIKDIIPTTFVNLKHEMEELKANMINVATEDMKQQVLS